MEADKVIVEKMGPFSTSKKGEQRKVVWEGNFHIIFIQFCVWFFYESFHFLELIEFFA